MNPVSVLQAGCASDDPLKKAFSEKTSADAQARRLPVDPSQTQQTWNQLAAEAVESGKRVVYVHIPFCKTALQLLQIFPEHHSQTVGWRLC